MPKHLPVPCLETAFRFGGDTVSALIPEAAALNRSYPPGNAAPYWARLWPASLGLCEYLAAHPQLVTGKRVLELAAGLGLPGLLAAQRAKSVIISDIDPDAVQVMNGSIQRSGHSNLSCRVMDWAMIPDDIQAEVVLLSDVNYDPEVFDTLFASLHALLGRGVSVVLSTPQRLMAKPFIERLLPRCIDQAEMAVADEFISIFRLQ